MQSSLTHHTATRKSLEVIVPASEVTAEFSKVIAKLTPKVKIPGFRPGKAPKAVLLSRYEREIQSEVAEALVDKHFMEAATAAGTQPISRPALEKVELKEGADGMFSAQFDVAPQVTLPEYKGITVVKKKRTSTRPPWPSSWRPCASEAAKFIPVEDGARRAGPLRHPGHQGQAPGHEGHGLQGPGDPAGRRPPVRRRDPRHAGGRDPQVLHHHPRRRRQPPMAGKPIAYEVTMKDLRVREVPELNDDFAKDLGPHAGLDDLKVFVRKELEEPAERGRQRPGAPGHPGRLPGRSRRSRCPPPWWPCS